MPVRAIAPRPPVAVKLVASTVAPAAATQKGTSRIWAITSPPVSSTKLTDTMSVEIIE
ncbi:hypothetical protein D3C86_2253510 [compost metagenome]